MDLGRAGIDDISRTVRSAFHPLRILRMDKSYTLDELSARSGLSPWEIHRIEMQQRNPKPKTVYKLAKALGVNPAELYVAVLEYGMEKIESQTARTLRIIAKPGESPKQMIARLIHRQLHPFYLEMRKLNKSMNAFLEEIDVSRATIKNWLDSRNVPTLKTMQKVAAGLGVSLDNLLERTEEWKKEDLKDPVMYIEKNIHRLGE